MDQLSAATGPDEGHVVVTKDRGDAQLQGALAVGDDRPSVVVGAVRAAHLTADVGDEGAARAPIKVRELVGQPTFAGLVATAEAGRPARWSHPPEVLLTQPDGSRFAIGVLATRAKRSAHPVHTAARDALVALVNDGGSRRGRPPR